jgi:hypothetical protein
MVMAAAVSDIRALAECTIARLQVVERISDQRS